MPGTAVIPVPPFAVPQGHHTAPEHGWKERARAGAGDKQLENRDVFAFAIQRGCVLSPQSVLPEKSLERTHRKPFVYKQDLVKSAVLRWRKK